jgi:hypothetical protein
MITFKGTYGEWYLNKRNPRLFEVRDYHGKLIAELENYEMNKQIMSIHECEANAKLIAAAPKLLEALIEVVKISDRNLIAWDKAKEAIKKATE